MYLFNGNSKLGPKGRDLIILITTAAAYFEFSGHTRMLGARVSHSSNKERPPGRVWKSQVCPSRRKAVTTP